MRRAAATLSILALFLMGMVIGAFGMHLLERHHLPWHGAGGRPIHGPGMGGSGPPHFPPHFMEGLEDQMDLTPEQSEQVHRILEHGRLQAEALRHDVAPRVHAQMEETHRQIMEILTPGQRRHLEELMPRRRQSPPNP
jgi:Spy/CpxP family protein refolding chaperone